MLPSGGQATFDNRVGWARTYMKKAGLLESPRRSYFKITDRGLQALKTNPESINNRFLQQYPEFREFKTRSNTKAVDTEPGASNLYLESRQVGPVLIVLIRDDGRGFDTNNPQPGLRYLRQRTAEVNADLDVLSAPKRGTAAQVRFRKHEDIAAKRLKCP